MQAKDIPEIPVLRYLKNARPHWSNLDNVMVHAMPPETPRKIALAKLRAMKKKNLISGCTCGCRGDFEIQGLGEATLADTDRVNSC